MRFLNPHKVMANADESWTNIIFTKLDSSGGGGSSGGSAEQVVDADGNTKITAEENLADNNQLKFYTNITDINNPDNELRMIINNDGNIGMGSSNFSAQVDIEGDINLTGDIYQNGSLLVNETAEIDQWVLTSRRDRRIFQ